MKIKKKILVLLFLVILSHVFAVSASAPQTAGVSADNVILWKIETFFENANVLVTSDPAIKVQKSLNHAEERIAEIEKMVRWNKTDAAEKTLNKYDAILEKTSVIISDIDNNDKQLALERELKIDAIIATYFSHLAQLEQLFTFTSSDEAQISFLSKTKERMMKTSSSLEQSLIEKKKETISALKANGLTEQDIITMQEEIFAKISQSFLPSAASSLKEGLNLTLSSFVNSSMNDSLLTSLASNASSFAENVASAAATFLYENETNSSVDSNPVQVVATISDASSKNKLKIDGTITSDQEQKINILYQQLQTENTKAEIEITVSQTQSGLWRIEKEIDGILSEQQNAQLDDLLLSFRNPANAVSIKIKYAPVSSAFESTAMYSGTSDTGVSTSFQIG